MNRSSIDGLELLVKLDIILNKEQSEIFKRRYDYVGRIYKEKHIQIDYSGLIKVTAVAYSYINDEKNPDQNLQDEFYEKLKSNSATMNKIRVLSQKRRIIMHTMN